MLFFTLMMILLVVMGCYALYVASRKKPARLLSFAYAIMSEQHARLFVKISVICYSLFCFSVAGLLWLMFLA